MTRALRTFWTFDEGVIGRALTDGLEKRSRPEA
jgi:hypothetical protein